ncbi:MAG: formyl transferase [Magnetococcales bacterium]|nr:formyl transferase [Magnetococcales bacterium]
MKSFLVISTDTPHHRHFLNRLADQGLLPVACLMETHHHAPPFPVGPLFEEEEARFEAERFFKDTRADLERIPCQDHPSANTPEAHALIRQLRPALGVVFGAGKLTAATIALFPDGLINVHRGLAQTYRGLDSDLWAIYHRDYEAIGVTIHRVEPELDTGEIVAQERMTLLPGMRCHQIRYYTTVIATRLVGAALHAYLAGHMTSCPQESLGRYYSFMPLALKQIVATRFDRHCASLTP